jgi:hypothetical protein
MVATLSFRGILFLFNLSALFDCCIAYQFSDIRLSIFGPSDVVCYCTLLYAGIKWGDLCILVRNLTVSFVTF